MKYWSTLIPTLQGVVSRQRTRYQIGDIIEMIKTGSAVGGYGRPASLDFTPLTFFLAVRSTTMAPKSMIVLFLFAPLCGLNWILDSLNPILSVNVEVVIFLSHG